MRGGETEREKERDRRRPPWFARGDSLSRLRIVEMNLSPENLRKSRRNEKQEERLSRRAGFRRNDADVGDKNAPTSSLAGGERSLPRNGGCEDLRRYIGCDR